MPADTDTSNNNKIIKVNIYRDIENTRCNQKLSELNLYILKTKKSKIQINISTQVCNLYNKVSRCLDI